MVKRIFAFGDSFLSGHGVNFDDNWLSVLSKKLNIEVNNHAVSGGSNKLSINKFFDSLEQILTDKENLVIFAWTSPVRTTFYNVDKHTWENVQLGHYYEDIKVRQRVEHYYHHYYNDYEAYVEFYQQQLMLTGFLESKNIQYYYIDSFFDAAYGPTVVDNKDYLEKFINKDKYILANQSIYDLVCRQQQMVCGDKFHPSEQGHAWLAEQVIEFFKNRSII
jgi:hypothetical protein